MANEDQLKRLRQGVREWNTWRRKNPERIDLIGTNLAEADLSGADLSEAHLIGTNLSEAHLIGAHLSMAHLSRANLRMANLSGADLSGADLSGADLSGANLSMANLSGAKLSMANLSGAKLSGTNLSGANLSGAHLTRAHLTRANLTRTNLIVTNLSEAHLSRANLSGADLTGANFSGANLSGAHLIGADLSGANLSGANLSGAHLSGANLSEANFSGADLSWVVLAMNNLISVRGLDTIKRHNPPRIDFRTVVFPAPGAVLTTFLRGVGSSEYLIEAVNGRSLPLQPVPVKVFISFASSDQSLCQSLREHLSLLVRLRMIVLSHEEVLAPHIHQWETKVSTAFQEAQVILLLVSAPFLASHQAWKDIIEPALHRHQRGSIRLIPIILRPTAWKGSSLAELQSLPTDGKPVTEWEQIDTPLTDVSEGLRKVVQPLHEAMMEQAMKRRERDLVTANLILTKTQAAEKQRTIEEQKKVVEEAEKACQALQTQLQEAQHHHQDLFQAQETLLADLALLERASTKLDEIVHTLDTQIQSREGMINGTGQ